MTDKNHELNTKRRGPDVYIYIYHLLNHQHVPSICLLYVQNENYVHKAPEMNQILHMYVHLEIKGAKDAMCTYGTGRNLGPIDWQTRKLSLH